MNDFSLHLERTCIILDALKDNIKYSQIKKYLPWLSTTNSFDHFESNLTESSNKLFTVHLEPDSWDNYYIFSNKYIIFNNDVKSNFVRVETIISEEEFFQQSIITDFKTLQYTDIVALRKIKSSLQHIIGIN